MSLTTEVTPDVTLDGWREALRGRDLRVALPDGDDDRAVRAALKLRDEGIVHPLLFGDGARLRAAGAAEELIVDVAEALADDRTEAALAAGFARRPENLDAARRDPVSVAAAALRAGVVDACVAGATRPTADVLRAGLRIVGLAPGVSTLSSCFLLLLPDGRRLTFSDCAVVPEPGADQLADIALAAAATHRGLTGEDPVVAMLSFSTQGSAAHQRVDVVREATSLVRQREPGLPVDGELQFDAALVASIAAAKAPGSAVMRPRERPRLPESGRRQHRLQDRRTARRSRRARPDPPGPRRAPQRSLPRLLGLRHRDARAPERRPS